MFSLFSSKNKKENSIRSVWNIDSQAVSVMFVDEQKTVIFYRSYYHNFSVHDKRYVALQLQESVITNIQKIITDVQNRNIPLPEYADIVLGEPWSHGITRKIHQTRKTNFIVSKQFIKDLITRDVQTIDRNRYSYDNAVHTEFSRPHIHSVSFAGHVVNSWLNKKTSDIRVEYSLGFFDKKITQMIMQKIHEKLRIKMLDIRFHNYQIVHYSYWEKTVSIPSLIVYPSGLLTSIFWVEKKNLKAFGTIPVGTQVFYDYIKQQLRISEQEINTLIDLGSQKKIHDTVIKKMQHSFQEVYEDWELAFQKFCSQLVNDGMTIEQVIWMGGGVQQMSQLIMDSVRKDSASFPVVFGSQRVNIVQGSPLFISSTAMRDTDRIILHWLHNS